MGMEMKAVVHKASVPVSLVQVSRFDHEKLDKDKAVQRVFSFLHGAAGKMSSSVLASAAMRVEVSRDHFVKVRELIKDLINKLKADSIAEVDRKGFCDGAMEKAVKARDEAKAKIETAESQLTTLRSAAAS